MSERLDDHTIEVPQSDMDWALLTSAVITLAVSGIALFIFYFLRNKWFHKYYTQNPRAPREDSVWYSWILDTIWRYDDESTLRNHGLDTLMFFWIIRVCLILNAAFLIYGIILILPFNIAGSRSRVDNPDDKLTPRVSGTAIQTFANINPKYIPDLYFQISHAIMMVFNTVVFMVVTLWVYKKFVAYRLRYKLRKKPENYTVRISGFDKKEFPTEIELKAVIERIFGPDSVQVIHIVPIGDGVSKLAALKARRFSYVTRKEEALIALTELEEKRAKKGGDKDEDYLKKENKLKREVRFSHQQIVDTDRQMDEVMEQDSTDWKFSIVEKIKAALRNIPPFSMIKKRVPNDFDDENDEAFTTVVEPSHPRKLQRHFPKQMSDTAYVTFRKLSDARLCANGYLTDNVKCNITPAVSPDEVAWGNHVAKKIPIVVFVKKFIGFVVSVAFCILWVIPIIFAVGLSNLPTIKRYIPALTPVIDFIAAAPVLGGIVIGFLPQIVIIIFFILLVPILQFIQQIFDHSKSLSRQTEIVMNKYFWFCVVNIFLAGVMFNSFDAIRQQLTQLALSPLQIVPLLGRMIPLQTNFFTQYVLVNGLMPACLALLNLFACIIFFLKKKILTGKDPRSQAELWLPGTYIWIQTIPQITFMFLIVVVFSAISPLLVALGLIFFLGWYFNARYTLLYQQIQTWDSGGMLWVTAFRQLWIGMLIYLVVMLGMFISNVWILGIVLAPICFVSLLFFAFYVEAIYRPLAYYGSLYPRAIEDERQLKSPNTYYWSYQHEALTPPHLTETEIIQEGLTSAEKDEKRDMILAHKSKKSRRNEYYERNYSDGDEEEELISHEDPTDSKMRKMRESAVV